GMIFPPGWVLTALIALAWPVLVLWRYPQAWEIWTVHITDRLTARSTYFAGESWSEYLLSPLVQMLPWTPLAILGAWGALHRSLSQQVARADAVFCSWVAVPAILVSLGSIRNGHYLIYALPPWSIAAALGLKHIADRLEIQGWGQHRRLVASSVLFMTVGLGY